MLAEPVPDQRERALINEVRRYRTLALLATHRAVVEPSYWIFTGSHAVSIGAYDPTSGRCAMGRK